MIQKRFHRFIITGASRGIGLALTREVLSRGATVAALCRNPGGAEDLQRLRAEFSDRLLLHAADVTDEESLAHAAAAASKWFPTGVDVLVNNAGVLLTREIPEVRDFNLTQITQTMDVNVLGPLRVVQAFLPLMTERSTTPPGDSIVEDGATPRGVVANITSIMGSLTLVKERRNYSYSVSKAALNMLSRLLHQDLLLKDLAVVSIHPGWVRTGMGGENATYSVEESAAGLYQRITEWRWGDPEFFDFRGEPIPW